MNVSVISNLMKVNDRLAVANRERLDEYQIKAVNMISSPGSGKTALLQRTLAALAGEYRCAVLVGDLATSRDAERLASVDVPIIQINTGKGCHLDAGQINQGLDQLYLDQLDILFIENVGNMVCPSQFDLGEHVKVAMMSLPEGDDKVAKYPILFQKADCVILNKLDLCSAMAFDMSQFEDDLRHVNDAIPVFPLSAMTGEGMAAWLNWLRSLVSGPLSELRNQRSSELTLFEV